jgi:hypothetical protein
VDIQVSENTAQQIDNLGRTLNLSHKAVASVIFVLGQSLLRTYETQEDKTWWRITKEQLEEEIHEARKRYPK